MLTVYRKTETNKEAYLNQVLIQTKKELKSNDFNLKVQAAFKLLFLFNEGIDIQWAAFNVIELMAHSKMQAKRISYSLAPLVFLELAGKSKSAIGNGELQTLLTLTPNIFRKDFQSIGEEQQIY